MTRTATLAFLALSFTALATPRAAAAEAPAPREDEQCIAGADMETCTGTPKDEDTKESLMQTKTIIAGTNSLGAASDDAASDDAASEDAEVFTDMETAKQTLEERGTKKYADANGVAFLQFLEKAVNDAVGPRGEVVVGLLEERNPCARDTYLQDTFVHGDLKSASFICQQCHPSCVGHCYGAGRHECHELAPEEGRAQGGPGAAFVQTFHEDLLKHMKELTPNATEDSSTEPLDDATVQKALAEGMGSLTVSEFQETTGEPDYQGATSEIISVAAEDDADTQVTNTADMDEPTLHMLHAMEKAQTEDGYLTNNGPMSDQALAAYEGQLVDETGHRFDPTPEGEKNVSLLELDDSSSETRRKAVSWLAKRKLKSIAKDHSNKASHYVKTEIKAWIDAQEGDCLDSVTLVTEAMQNVFECFKANYNQLKSSFCDPPPKHKQIKDSLTGIRSASVNINYVANLLKNVPRVGPIAKTVIRVTDQINSRSQSTLNQLDRQNKQDKGRSANSDCCPPFPAGGCSSYPGWKYKCGACSSGEICNSQQACNTLVKLEQKIDNYKALYYDPMVEKVAEAAQNVQAGNNLVHGDSLLAACGMRNCGDLKRAATQIKRELDAAFHEKVCPLKVANFPVPTLGPLNVVANIFGSINGFLQSLRNILAKMHCVNYPRTQAYTTRECTRVCIHCCSYHGRRRWTGSVSCRHCCHNVCVNVPRIRAWMERYCFSAEKILSFISGLFKIIFGPIMAIIDAALKPFLDLIMRPINALFNQLFGHLKINFPAFPNMPLLDLTLPTIPSFSLSIPHVNIHHPTCKWIRSKAGI